MKAKIEAQGRKALANHIQSTCERISVEGYHGAFNFRCFENAVQFAVDKNWGVVEVMYMDSDGDPILHYINIDDDGTYIETTLGWRAQYHDYYLLRKIHPAEYANIRVIFSRTLDYYRDTIITGWRRLFKVDRIC